MYFQWTLQNSTLAWGANFVNSHLNYTFEFVQDFCKRYHKVQTNEQVFMNLQTIKQNLNEWVEEYYKCILSLANSFQRQPSS